MGGLCLGLGEIKHQEEEAISEVGSEDGADGASHTEGILSIASEIGRGALLHVQVWREPGDYLSVTAGDKRKVAGGWVPLV